MTIINNITNVLLDNEYTSSNTIILNIFKESLSHLLLINEKLANKIINNTSKDNNSLLYSLNFEKENIQENGLEIIYSGVNYYITKIFIQNYGRVIKKIWYSSMRIMMRNFF